jgi:hypothetical protein
MLVGWDGITKEGQGLSLRSHSSDEEHRRNLRLLRPWTPLKAEPLKSIRFRQGEGDPGQIS